MRDKIPISNPTTTKMGNLARNIGPHPKQKSTRRNYRELEEEEIKCNVKNNNMAEAIPLPSKVSNTFKNVTLDLISQKILSMTLSHPW